MKSLIKKLKAGGKHIIIELNDFGVTVDISTPNNDPKNKKYIQMPRADYKQFNKEVRKYSGPFRIVYANLF